MNTITNPLLNKFHGYRVQHPNTVPFQNNHLINQNVHVMNNLNTHMKDHQMLNRNIQKHDVPMNNFTRKNQNNGKKINIIEEMLKPIKIERDAEDNKDVHTSYEARRNIQEEVKKGNFNIKITNAPYKCIIKDKIINKNVEDVTEEDLVVHKSVRGVDDDINIFNKQMSKLEKEKEEINEELAVEFHVDNYDKHKKKFEYKETFIKNLKSDTKDFDENKQDYIDFYNQKQKEAEEGLKMCDNVLKNLVDDGFIDQNELPTVSESETTEVNLDDAIKDVEIDYVSNEGIDNIHKEGTDNIHNEGIDNIHKEGIDNIRNTDNSLDNRNRVTSSSYSDIDSMPTYSDLDDMPSYSETNVVKTSPKISKKSMLRNYKSGSRHMKRKK